MMDGRRRGRPRRKAPAPAESVPVEPVEPKKPSGPLRVRTLVALQDEGIIYPPGTVLERPAEWVEVNVRLGLVEVVEA
jgi:hypothetical protein